MNALASAPALGCFFRLEAEAAGGGAMGTGVPATTPVAAPAKGGLAAGGKVADGDTALKVAAAGATEAAEAVGAAETAEAVAVLRAGAGTAAAGAAGAVVVEEEAAWKIAAPRAGAGWLRLWRLIVLSEGGTGAGPALGNPGPAAAGGGGGGGGGGACAGGGDSRCTAGPAPLAGKAKGSREGRTRWKNRPPPFRGGRAVCAPLP